SLRPVVGSHGGGAGPPRPRRSPGGPPPRPPLCPPPPGEAPRRIRSGTLSPSNLLASCFKRIDAVEPTLKAWVHLDRDAAARVAVQRDMEAREGGFMGSLPGVPVAPEDIDCAAGRVEPRTRGAREDCS